MYECYDGDAPELIELKFKYHKDFEEGVKLFLDGSFKDASRLFTQLIHDNPQDLVAKHFLSRSSKLGIEGVPENWSGVEELMSKW